MSAQTPPAPAPTTRDPLSDDQSLSRTTPLMPPAEGCLRQLHAEMNAQAPRADCRAQASTAQARSAGPCPEALAQRSQPCRETRLHAVPHTVGFSGLEHFLRRVL